MADRNKTPFMVVIMAIVAATGGLLFGFDTGVISGAIPFLQQDFGIGDPQAETLTTAGLIGAILGAMFGGKIADRFGRRTIIIVSGIIFAVGALWCGMSHSLGSLVAARLFLGIAIGTASFAVPLYIAEISPANVRGSLVSLFQLMITIGILVSYFSDWIFANDANPSCWRPMFYVGVIPALILLTGMFFMPESPRWIESRGQVKEEASWKELFCKEWRYPVIIAVCIMFIQQFVGINTVIYYSPKIFTLAGFSGSAAAIGASIGVGAINVLATIISVWVVDRIGRRKLFFCGMVGMVFSLGLLGSSFLMDFGTAGPYITVACTLLYVTFYAISVGPLGWLIISEIFPQKLRGLGSSIGSLSVWVFNSIVTFTFFKIANAFSSPAGSFFVYAFIALLGIVWGIFLMPETKGKTLEEIEAHWKNGGRPDEL